MKRFSILSGRIERATSGSMGFDVFYNGPGVFMLKAGRRAKIPTGVRSQFSPDLQVVLWDKSSLADVGLEVRAGCIDSDYPDEWFVVLHNSSDSDYFIQPGQKIAQALIMEVPQVTFEEAGGTVTLKNDIRKGGFGSTN